MFEETRKAVHEKAIAIAGNYVMVGVLAQMIVNMEFQRYQQHNPWNPNAPMRSRWLHKAISVTLTTPAYCAAKTAAYVAYLTEPKQ